MMDDVLDRVVLGNTLLRWLIAFAVVLGAAIAGRILGAVLRSLSRHGSSRILPLVADEIGPPVTLMVTAFGLRMGVESLSLPARVETLLASGVKFATVLLLTWAVVRAYEAVHNGVFMPLGGKADSRIDQHFFNVVRTVLRPLFWIVGTAMALNSVGFNVSAILAGIGIGGMAVALASQDTVANVFGGVLILLQRPFKIGERIEVAGVNGWVQQINLRNTVVMNWYGRLVTIPNKKFTDDVLTNIDTQTCYYEEVRLRLDPESTAADVENALKILGEIVQSVDIVEKSPWIGLDKIGHGFLEIELWYAIMKWTPDDKERFANWYTKISHARTMVNLGILRRFAEAGITLALPLEVHVQRDEDPERRRSTVKMKDSA